MNAVGYCRISKQEEEDGKGYYLQLQKQKIREYCKKNQIEIFHIYIDAGISSDEINRHALNSIFTLNAEHALYDSIIVEKPEVISEDKDVYFTIKAFLQNAGFHLICVEEDFSEEDLAEEKLIMKSVSLVEKLNDQHQKGLLSYDTDKEEKKAAKGRSYGGRTLFGYKIAGGKCMIDQREAEIVRFIFKCNAEGETPAEIVKKCRETGRTNRKGKSFEAGSIKSILRNRKIYEGYYHYRGFNNGETWIKGEQEPILDDDEW